MKSRYFMFALLFVVVGVIGVLAVPALAGRDLILATTTSTKDTGLLDHLLPVFEKQRGIKVKVISVGTGQAIKLGELGDCDALLVHARAAEDKFVADGFGVDRRDVMYNDFVLVGPASDPARTRGLAPAAAMKALSGGKGVFLSRGDDSGTHQKEKELWLKAGVEPRGQWYMSVGKGMGDTLLMASELRAYTLADRGTYAAMKTRLELSVLVAGDPLLLNPYGVIAVNPAKSPGVNYAEAKAFITFITSPEAKTLIDNYRVNGEQLFHAM